MRIAITEQACSAIAPPAEWVNSEAAMRITPVRKQRVTRAALTLTPLFDDDEAHKIVITSAWTPRRPFGR